MLEVALAARAGMVKERKSRAYACSKAVETEATASR